MEDWFELYPNRLQEEVDELRAHGILVDDPIIDDTVNEYGIRLFCTIQKENKLDLELDSDLQLKIVFPSNFPYFRPEVYVTNNYSQPRHQSPQDKALCLIPRPSQFWDVRDSVYSYLKERLPIVFSKGNETDQEVISNDPDEQAEPISEYYFSYANAAVFSLRPEFPISALPDSDTFSILDSGKLRLAVSPNSSKVKLVDNIFFSNGASHLITKRYRDSELLKIEIKEWINSTGHTFCDFPSNHLSKGHQIRMASWYQISSLEWLFSNDKGVDGLFDVIHNIGLLPPHKCNIKTQQFNINYIIALRFPEEVSAGVIGWGWGLLVLGEFSMSISRKNRLNKPHALFLPIMSLDPSDLTSRIPNSKYLFDKTISVIGLGSIGAPAVLEFARNGVSKLKLMDFDIVETTSSVRWPLGLESAGLFKTIALKEFIEYHFPNVQVDIFNHKIGSTDFIAFPNESLVLEQFLDDTSLVFDASAEEGVNNLVSSICKERSIPYMEIEGRRGAWGGLVMRTIPNTDSGCWMCLQYALYEDKIIPIPKEDHSGTIQPRGCGDPTFTGSSFDLQNISLAGVRMAISTLSKNESCGDWDVAILSLVDEENNPVAPHWSTHELKVNPNCPICNANRMDKA